MMKKMVATKDGVKEITLSAEEEAEILAKRAASIKEKEARNAEYLKQSEKPTPEELFEIMYTDGVDGVIKAMKAFKDKYK